LPQREAFLKPLFKKELDLVILFVTSICNARCRTCFYWLKLNRRGDMTYEELSKLSSTMPRFQDLWLSGGEPFLRKDLAQIIRLFYTNNGIRGVRIPTNGLPTEQTLNAVKAVLEQCPDLQLEIDISIDGFSETHDRIRSVLGNFRKALETMAQLENLRLEWPNLTLYVNSVITSENRTELVQLGHYFKQNNSLDGHYFQIIRGDPKDRTLQTIEPELLRETYREVLPINLHYISKGPRKKSKLGSWRKAFWRAGYVFSYDTQFRNYAYGEKWKMPCTAGRTSIVIDYNADVRVCELRKPIGNLRKLGMDFGRFWNSIERKNEVQRVKSDQCFCTHICFMYDSMRHSKRVMLWELPKLFIEEAFKGLNRRGAEADNAAVERVKEAIPAGSVS
jgi:MoaA/NifB/PqqE/SkfB family radical SAM enzyme